VFEKLVPPSLGIYRVNLRIKLDTKTEPPYYDLNTNALWDGTQWTLEDGTVISTLSFSDSTSLLLLSWKYLIYICSSWNGLDVMEVVVHKEENDKTKTNHSWD
jgi:hypothetical protein